MRVGLITRHLGMPVGLGTYGANLLRALDRRDDDNEYFIYAPGWNEAPPLGPRFHVRKWPMPSWSRATLYAWDPTLPAIAAARDRVDLIHYLHAGYPAFSPGRPVIVNLMDAIGWVVPGYRLPQPYQWLEGRAARRADLVLTLSESARSDLARVLGLSPAKIRVIYLGGPPLDSEDSDPEPYILFVGGTEKRKNLGTVLEAFSSIDDLELRVVGRHKASPVHDGRREQPGVRWLGHVSEEELVELYRHATALVFPSRYEGFGLPILEAMAHRTPVIASNTSSIPEVARDAALLVDPDDIGAVRGAIRRVAEDSRLRAELTRRGVEVLASFSWDETARATAAAYEELYASR